MPKKRSDATPGMKLLGLYWLLLFTGRKYYLPDLAERLECSKQTILRLMEQIEASGWAYIESGIEGGRRWWRLNPPQERPQVSLDVENIQNLLLCRDMVWHLLPDSMREDVGRTIGHATTLLRDVEDRAAAMTHLAQARTKGAIDYSTKEDILQTLLEAMRDQRVCRVVYRSPARPEPGTYHVAPFKLVAYREALYARCWFLWEDGIPPEVHEMTLAVHRIETAELTERTFQKEEPGAGKAAPQTFGFMDDQPFRVRVAFSPAVAAYVSERIWSDDQTIEEQDDGGVILEFTATSEPEVISWVLSFGAEARLMEPNNLRRRIVDEAKWIIKKQEELEDE